MVVTAMLGMPVATGFSTGRVVGMRHLFDAILRLAALAVRTLLCGSFEFVDRLGRASCMNFAAFVVCMRVLVMIVQIMIMLMQRLLIAKLVMMVGFGHVRLRIAMPCVLKFAEIVDRPLVGVFRLAGDLRLKARVLDHLALDALAIAAPARAAMARTAPIGAIFILFLGLAMSALVGFDQGLTVGDRDLIVVRVNFAEGKKAMAVAAVFDKGGLKRRLHARDFGQIDVAAKLFALSGLEIKLFDAIAADHDDPGLLRVGGIDKHFVGHFVTLGGGGHV